jgi:cysteine desulfurase family protein (TIGR01976 family)
MTQLNTQWIRQQFPGLSGGFAFFDNAGGTQVARQVGDKISDYLYHTNVQLGASYPISQQSGTRVDEAQALWAQAINATRTEEVVLGSSTTALVQNLARSYRQLLKPGDEVIVTNMDHEANIGPWMEMEKSGIVVKVWEVNPLTFDLDLEALDKLMTPQTRLVAFTHISNILGTINPVKEITKFVHDRKALVFVDGVAYAPHRAIDVQDWEVDFYVFSLYKVYGPHYSLLYGKFHLLEELPGINHFFIEKDDIPYKLQPGNVNYELTYGSAGIISYFKEVYNQHFTDDELGLHEQLKKVFSLIAHHEASLAQPLIDWVNSRDNLRMIGASTADKLVRVPTISFVVENRKSSEIPLLVDPHQMGIRWGDFYAKRLIEALRLDKNDGVVRVSLVHYNTLEEVNRLVKVVDKLV